MPTQHHALRTFSHAVIWIGVAGAAFLLWRMRIALLFGFGAILFAVVLTLLAAAVCRVTRVRRGIALAISTTAVLGAIAIVLWVFGASLSQQFSQLAQRVEAGGKALAALFPQGLAKSMADRGASFFGNAVPAVLSSGLNIAEDVVIIGVAAIYLAAQPEVYRRGLAAVFPRGMRSRVLNALDLVGSSLKLWVLGQLILMLMVGILSYLATLALGLPNPVVLGLIAGFTEIIPYLGPFIGAAPAVFAGLTQSLAMAGWAMAAYLAIHVFEGYLVGPLLQRWFVWIPPVLVLMSILANQLIFGFVGVVFAAPIAVAVFAAVKVLYVRDTLHEPANLPTHTPL